MSHCHVTRMMRFVRHVLTCFRVLAEAVCGTKLAVVDLIRMHFFLYCFTYYLVMLLTFLINTQFHGFGYVYSLP